VKIRITDCKIADSCGKCLKVCPEGALIKVPLGKMKSSSEKPKYTIKPFYDRLCTGCGKCVSVCPKRAIRLKG
jgi:ferredoxin